MPFLTVGISTVEIQHAGATEEAPERIGGLDRSFSGELRSTQRARKRKWRFTGGIMTQAAYDALIAAADTGAAVNCGGDALSGVTVSCVVQVEGGDYIPDGLGHKRAANITLLEV